MFIIGPPGSGKGTQAERISERVGVVAISTGDIFRANVKGETPLGVKAKKYMDAGDFVPDSVTNRMVRDRLSVSDVDDGFLLDGYPRTTAQVDYLDGILAEGGQSVDVVLQLTADDEELVAHGFWAVRRNLHAATTMRRSSATAWTSTVSRPRPLWPRTPSAAS
jgi:adenylate kinase